jgi:hypothetical protein
MPRGIPNKRPALPGETVSVTNFSPPDSPAAVASMASESVAPVIAQEPSAPAATRPPKKLPRIVILDDNFGFMQNGSLRQWKDGETVTDPVCIAQLIERNAPLKDLSL